MTIGWKSALLVRAWLACTDESPTSGPPLCRPSVAQPSSQTRLRGVMFWQEGNKKAAFHLGGMFQFSADDETWDSGSSATRGSISRCRGWALANQFFWHACGSSVLHVQLWRMPIFSSSARKALPILHFWPWLRDRKVAQRFASSVPVMAAPEEEIASANYEGEGSDANIVRVHHAVSCNLQCWLQAQHCAFI